MNKKVQKGHSSKAAKPARTSSTTKRAKKREMETTPDDESDSSGFKTVPGQRGIKVVEMEDILRRLGPRRCTEWTVNEKAELARFMSNRAGIDASDKAAIYRAGLAGLFEQWLNEYIRLYETDPEFEKAIDPWQVVVISKPEDEAVYVNLLNMCSHFLVNVDRGFDADEDGSPLKCMHNTNWILHFPMGREDARRAVAFMKGFCEDANLPFEAIVQDYRTSMKDC